MLTGLTSAKDNLPQPKTFSLSSRASAEGFVSWLHYRLTSMSLYAATLLITTFELLNKYGITKTLKSY